MQVASALAAHARAGTLDPAQVAEVALAQARSRLQFDIGLVIGWDEAARALAPIYISDPHFNFVRPQPGEGALGVAFAERRILRLDDYQAWPDAMPETRAAGIASMLCVPMMTGDRAAGVIGVATYKARNFSEADAQLLAGVAAQLAPAIEAARLAAEREVQGRVFKALQEVAQAASGSQSPAELARVAVDRARDLLGVDSAFLALPDPDDGLLRPLADNDPAGPADWALGPSEGVTGRCFATASPVVAADYARFTGALPWALARGQASLVAVPLMVGDRVTGVLGLVSSTPRGFTPEDVAVLLLLASQVAPAIEAARLLREREAQVRELRALHEVAVAASGVFTLAELARLAVDHACEQLGVDSAVLRHWDPADGVLRMLAHRDSGNRRHVDAITPDEGFLGRAFREGRPVLSEVYTNAESALPWAAEDGVRTALAVPLLVGQRPVGGLVVTTYGPHHYGSAQVRLLTLLAAQVAPAVEAARLVEERERQQETMRSLRQLAADASGLLEPAAIAQIAIDKATEMLRADSTVLTWLDPATGVVRSLIERGDHRMSVLPGEGAVGMAFQTGQPVIVNDYQSWRGRLPGNRESQAIAAVPLFSGAQPVGAMAVRSNSPRNFTYQEAETLALIGAQVVPALEAARLHKSLAASEAEFRSLFENVACGVIVLSPEGIVLDANRAALNIFDIARDKVVGHPLSDVGWERRLEDGSPLTPETSPALIAAREGRKVGNVVLHYTRPGRDMWLQIDAVPQIEEGRVARVVASFIDISGVKEAEASRRESEAKSKFLAAMSHELRTPLNSVLGFAQLLETGAGGELSERQRRYVDNIRSSGSHLLALVNDVLDLSKVAAGQMELALASVDLRRVLEESVARMRPLADEKRLRLELAAAGVPCAVQADERRLAQVAWNLLSNAIKFTPEGGRIRLTIHPGEPYAGFSVADTGIGIPADQLQRIFEEFTQVDSGRSRSHEGTGLGLPLSRQLVELMGGRIEARSRPGRGSTFKVWLPAR